MRLRVTRLCAPLLLLSATFALAAPAARAEPRPDAAVHAEAEDKFRRGREALAQGDHQRALALFRESHALERGRGKLVNIAICEEKLGLLATAMDHFEEVLPQLPAADERLPIVKKHLADLDSRVPRLRISLAPGAPAGTVVRRGSAGSGARRGEAEPESGAALPPASLGVELRLDPGQHLITASAPGLPERRYTISLGEGTRHALLIDFAPGVWAPAPAPASGPSGMRVGGFVAGGVGAAGLVLFAVAGGIALGHHGFVEEQCPSHMGCSAEVLNRAGAGKTMSILSAVGLGVGVAGLGVGIPLIFAGRAARAPAAAPKVGVAALPGGAIIGLGGGF